MGTPTPYLAITQDKEVHRISALERYSLWEQFFRAARRVRPSCTLLCYRSTNRRVHIAIGEGIRMRVGYGAVKSFFFVTIVSFLY